jgi:hypothetical protein
LNSVYREYLQTGIDKIAAQAASQISNGMAVSNNEDLQNQIKTISNMFSKTLEEKLIYEFHRSGWKI